MLVLSRRLNEKLLIPSIRTAVQVLSIQGGQVRLGIDAPPEVAVVREEIYEDDAERTAPAAPLDRVCGALRGRLAGLALDMGRVRRRVQGQLTPAARAELDRLADEFADLARVVKMLLKEDKAPAASRTVDCAR